VTSRGARLYVLGQLLLMVASYLALTYLGRRIGDERSSLDELAFAVTYVAIAMIGGVLLRAAYVARGMERRAPYRPDGISYMPCIRGTVVASADSFVGPDGRPCVAAVRVDGQYAHQSRWVPFSLDVDGEEVKVAPAEPGDKAARLYATSWVYTALRPRSFGGGAWAASLVDEQRLDWICVRPGDYVEIQSMGMRWIVGPSHARRAQGSTDSPGSSPFRSAPHLVVGITATDSEGFLPLVFEVIHPRHDLEWRVRQVVRDAILASRGAAFIAVFSWIPFAFQQLGPFAPMPWLLFVLAVVLLIPVYAAHIASTLPIVTTDPTPPPWQREADS
jgi:hypothetical protein